MASCESAHAHSSTTGSCRLRLLCWPLVPIVFRKQFQRDPTAALHRSCLWTTANRTCRIDLQSKSLLFCMLRVIAEMNSRGIVCRGYEKRGIDGLQQSLAQQYNSNSGQWVFEGIAVIPSVLNVRINGMHHSKQIFGGEGSAHGALRRGGSLPQEFGGPGVAPIDLCVCFPCSARPTGRSRDHLSKGAAPMPTTDLKSPTAITHGPICLARTFQRMAVPRQPLKLLETLEIRVLILVRHGSAGLVCSGSAGGPLLH